MILLLTGTANAGTQIAVDTPPPPDPPPIEWREQRAFFEWSTWIRLGAGVAREPAEPVAGTIARTVPSEVDQHGVFEAALGADVTFPIPTGRVRLGPWVELRNTGLFAGGELLVAGSPRELDMFWYKGEGVWSVRAGGNMTHATGALAYGYRAPWKLWGPYDTTTRYAIGVRLVASATRSVTVPDDWSMSLGLEFEPIGTLRYAAGIKSWY